MAQDRPGEAFDPWAAPCPDVAQSKGYVLRERPARSGVIDACGRVSRATDSRSPLARDAPATAILKPPATIDRMTTKTYHSPYSTIGTLTLVESADVYYLSNGTQWSSGAGMGRLHSSQVSSVDVFGPTVRYVLSPPATGLIYEQIDGNAGDHSSQGTLGPSGPLVLEAQIGSTTAVLRGNALVVSNNLTFYGEPRFNYFTALVGSVVPFEMVYTITGGATWQADTFTKSLACTGSGFVDFAHPVSAPRPVALEVLGPARVPETFTTPFRARARYENGVTRNVSGLASWTVTPPSAATIAGGVLTTGSLPTTEAVLTLRASFVQGPDSLVAERVVRCLAEDRAESPSGWPMFQANARHTGYVPLSLAPEAFRVEWRQELGKSFPLNPVAAGEGKVFTTVLWTSTPHLDALRAQDGAVLWSKEFPAGPGVYSVNPPSFAYGNVYVQTVSGEDSWLRAFDGATGSEAFEDLHGAGVERFYAPTLHQGTVYAEGGTYGGLFAFDAYGGGQTWFASLFPFDEWTPAVDGERVVAYVGPRLYMQDRLSGAAGAPEFIPDPNFEQLSTSMNQAPVVGSRGEVVAIHDDRLISFDPSAGSIRWEAQRAFLGQPSIAADRIYAIDAGRLVALDEATGAELWSWSPPSGALAGAMIVTDSHVLACTSGAVYAIDLGTHLAVWSYPVAGHLALAEGRLFVASPDGWLTAFSAPSPSLFHTVTPCRLLDTRASGGVLIGGPALQAGATREMRVAGNCGVPATARAVSLNVTATEANASGNVRLQPGGGASPSSAINYGPGQTRANNVVVALSSAGDLAALASQAAGTTVHLVIDVNGYFE